MYILYMQLARAASSARGLYRPSLCSEAARRAESRKRWMLGKGYVRFLAGQRFAELERADSPVRSVATDTTIALRCFPLTRRGQTQTDADRRGQGETEVRPDHCFSAVANFRFRCTVTSVHRTQPPSLRPTAARDRYRRPC